MPETNQTAGAPFAISRERRVVDIDAVDDVAGYVRVNGREITVHHLDAATYRALRQLAEAPQMFDVLTLYDAVKRCCPDLSHDEVDKLSGPKIGAILRVAEESIKEVEAQIPNGSGPTESTTESPPA